MCDRRYGIPILNIIYSPQVINLRYAISGNTVFPGICYYGETIKRSQLCVNTDCFFEFMRRDQTYGVVHLLYQFIQLFSTTAAEFPLIPLSAAAYPSDLLLPA